MFKRKEARNSTKFKELQIVKYSRRVGCMWSGQEGSCTLQRILTTENQCRALNKELHTYIAF